VTQPSLTGELLKYVLPTAQFDGLCLEASDARARARFWATALGGEVQEAGRGRFRIGPAPGRPQREILRINEVQNARQGGHRVHLDLRLAGAGPEHLVTAGAQIVSRPGQDPWFVMTDPEGNFFCAYPAVDDRPPGIFELVVKSGDAVAQACWWADVLGGTVVPEGEAAAVQAAPEFPWDYMLFDPVPEPKVAKNRLHWHVDLREREPSDLLAKGAVVCRQPETREGPWILADPEGNEFCAFPGRR
jgi:glyoxalase superfamily protein